ncbi:TPA: hypothetical protein ACLGU2_004815, partial [Salmonella enterica]
MPDKSTAAILIVLIIICITVTVTAPVTRRDCDRTGQTER